jgi:AcrR family transcriptional regulator
MTTESSSTKADILEKSISLFAASGYSAVSMRQIAKAVGITAASLYHHFPDKQTLYIQAIQQAFVSREFMLSEILAMDLPVREKLRLFVRRICEFIINDPDFSKLIHREILDSQEDETRLRLLGDQVFKKFAGAVMTLAGELAPDKDPHLTGISILSLVAYHFLLKPLRIYLPGARPAHNDLDTISDHITDLLLRKL